jgi:hypothetical protein
MENKANSISFRFKELKELVAYYTTDNRDSSNSFKMFMKKNKCTIKL